MVVGESLAEVVEWAMDNLEQVELVKGINLGQVVATMMVGVVALMAEVVVEGLAEVVEEILAEVVVEEILAEVVVESLAEVVVEGLGVVDSLGEEEEAVAHQEEGEVDSHAGDTFNPHTRPS